MLRFRSVDVVDQEFRTEVQSCLFRYDIPLTTILIESCSSKEISQKHQFRLDLSTASLRNRIWPWISLLLMISTLLPFTFHYANSEACMQCCNFLHLFDHFYSISSLLASISTPRRLFPQHDLPLVSNGFRYLQNQTSFTANLLFFLKFGPKKYIP